MFSGVVGHDLRNPLAAIMATSQMLLTLGPSEADVKPLQRIVASSERMARMIDQLLDFTRIRAGGGMPSDPQPMNWADVAHEVIEESRVAHPHREIVFDADGDLTGTWDGDRLAQVLSNLIANAVEHGASDTAAAIHVTANGTREDALVVTVSNAGPIRAELVPILFEPFRGTDYKRARGSGLGLGLYIAQQIVLVHGGTIDVVTTGPTRTTFAVTLPRSNKRLSPDDR
jgi:signal transduction histidine kinase